MMLDEKTLEWLKRRKNLCTRCAVKNCIMPNNKNRILGSCEWFEVKAPGSKTGKLREDYRDAAEFEARVAFKIARFFDIETCKMCSYQEDGCNKVKDKDGRRRKKPNEWCVLKRQRIAVEREMIQEGKRPGRPEKKI